MRFDIDWRVEERSTQGDKIVARGRVVKEAADRAAMQRDIDGTLLPMLKEAFPPETAFANHEYHVVVRELA